VQLFLVVHRRYLITVGGDRITGKCLDIAGGSGEIHSQIQLFRCHGEENQQFEFHYDGTIRIMGKCLDIPDSRAVDHQGVQLFYCRPGEENQRFAIDAENRIHVMHKCLDVPNGEIVNNNPLQLFECKHQANQHFTLIPV
jgi:glucosylceramidase